MIPKAVADRLRKGITALETCQVPNCPFKNLLEAGLSSRFLSSLRSEVNQRKQDV